MSLSFVSWVQRYEKLSNYSTFLMTFSLFTIFYWIEESAAMMHGLLSSGTSKGRLKANESSEQSQRLLRAGFMIAYGKVGKGRPPDIRRAGGG